MSRGSSTAEALFSHFQFRTVCSNLFIETENPIGGGSNWALASCDAMYGEHVGCYDPYKFIVDYLLFNVKHFLLKENKTGLDQEGIPAHGS
jgi:hypothetical protein